MVTLKYNGKEIKVPKGTLISSAIYSDTPCGGHGRCGKCRVIAIGELSPISENERKLLGEELGRGVRLACCTRIEEDCEIYDLDNKDIRTENILTVSDTANIAPDPDFSRFGVALDIGTTTLAARLYDPNGFLLASASADNPQSKLGADVISRIEAALDGRDGELAELIRGATDDIIISLCRSANISPRDIEKVVITGNTTMLHLLTLESVFPLSRAPFTAKRMFGEYLKAKELGLLSISPDTLIYLPPCISAFVGADTVCAIIATELCSSDTSRMLVDIGTNGEMAIWHKGCLRVTSTAAGPAFEGVGISMGMRASVGAIDKVRNENGRLCLHALGDVEPVGICGSGLIDVISCLVGIGELDDSGYLDDDPYYLTSKVTLTGADIRAVQLAKSAICAGLEALVSSAGADMGELDKLYVAGGFGNYLDRGSAASIGLIPSALAKNSQAVGNAALGGASMLLLNKGARDEGEKLARKAISVQLANDPIFAESYMMGMCLEPR